MIRAASTQVAPRTGQGISRCYARADVSRSDASARSLGRALLAVELGAAFRTTPREAKAASSSSVERRGDQEGSRPWPRRDPRTRNGRCRFLRSRLCRERRTECLPPTGLEQAVRRREVARRSRSLGGRVPRQASARRDRRRSLPRLRRCDRPGRDAVDRRLDPGGEPRDGSARAGRRTFAPPTSSTSSATRSSCSPRGTSTSAPAARSLVAGDLTIKERHAADRARGCVPRSRSRSRMGPSGPHSICAASSTRLDYGLTWNRLLETGGVLVGNVVELALGVAAVRDVGLELAA